MTGAHLKAVQTVMRHSSITLTMGTYGHLVPGQAADTIADLPSARYDGRQGPRSPESYRDDECQPFDTPTSNPTSRSAKQCQRARHDANEK